MDALTLERPTTTDRLLAEFRWRLDETEVSRVVERCAQDLAGSPVGALPELVERSARQRLASRLEGEPAR